MRCGIAFEMLQINLSVEAFITDTFGRDKWVEIVAAAHADTNWVSKESCSSDFAVCHGELSLSLSVIVSNALHARRRCRAARILTK